MHMLAEIFSANGSEGITRAIKLWFKASNHARADLLGLAAQNYGETHLGTSWRGGLLEMSGLEEGDRDVLRSWAKVIRQAAA